jgi:hypothetical protein
MQREACQALLHERADRQRTCRALQLQAETLEASVFELEKGLRACRRHILKLGRRLKLWNGIDLGDGLHPGAHQEHGLAPDVLPPSTARHGRPAARRQ